MSYDRDDLILTHLHLAEAIANREWRTATHALKRDDMLSLAYWGLLDAAEKWPAYCKKNEYDPGAIQYFKVYASLRIRGAIRDYIRAEDWATRTTRSKAKLLKEAGQDDGATLLELSDRTGMSVSEINKVISKLASRPISLDAYAYNHDTSQEAPSSARSELKDAVDTEGSAFANDMQKVFVNKFEMLNSEAKVILVLHYYSRMDLRAISLELGLSESKVSQIHAQSVVFIRDALIGASTESEAYV